MKQAIKTPSSVVSGMETLTLHLPAEQLSVFFPLLQSGVTVQATVGCTLKNLLCDQFAIPADYVTGRITTIFLDNRPVDDLEHTIVRNGSRLTLSAAMPGLVGATMRRGGFYAALRLGISHLSESGTAAAESGTVRLKLFNLLLAELGPLVLARGLVVEQSELDELLHQLPGQTDNLPACKCQTVLTVRFNE